MSRRAKIATVAVSASALLAGGLAVAAAEDAGPREATHERPAPHGHRGSLGHGLARFGLGDLRGLRSELAGSLARKLGVSRQRVLAATRAVLADRLAEKVRRGRLTHSERRALLRAYDLGRPRDAFRALRRRWRRHRLLGHGRGHRHPSPAVVRAKRDELFSDLGRELGRPGPEVRTAVRDVIAEKLEALVSAGLLRRHQADAVLRAFDTGERPFHGRPHGGGHRE